MEKQIIGLNEHKTQCFRTERKNGKIIYWYTCHADAVYGLGERYCSVNHKGRILVNRVFEQFTRQGENTYFPVPFYHASDGHGVFVNTLHEVLFSFEENENRIEIEEDAEHTIYFYYGNTKEIIEQFTKASGTPVLPPQWAFGVWASANRWNCQKDIEEQLALFEKHNYPVSVIVIEAWSDEATFYIWNGAQYSACEGGRALKLEDFTFHEPWPDPMQMIHNIHEKGIKLILWQIPALKELEEGREVKQHELDCNYAVKNNLVIKDGNLPYQIPRQWFIGSMVPDFSNPETVEFWKKKREYLLEQMEIDGYKTDGGEFIHDTRVEFYAGYDGKKGRNAYPALYEQAYQSMIGQGRVLFSRAGYLGSQTTPMHWAGDQVSDFEELKSVLNAGLSLSLSGVPFWSFDIGGFAGLLPDKELYLRATAFAAFVPAMQWHSEPADGQFEEIMKGCGGINDRSPWNMESVYRDKDILEKARYFANLHINFQPYFYSEAEKAVMQHLPFMRHLAIDYGNDQRARLCEDEYMIGDLLIAPIVEAGINKREVYLPEGNWHNLQNGEIYKGSCVIVVEADLGNIPLFLRAEGAIVLNLPQSGKMGEYVGNSDEYKNLYFIYGSECTQYAFHNDGRGFLWKDGKLFQENYPVKAIAIKEYIHIN